VVLFAMKSSQSRYVTYDTVCLEFPLAVIARRLFCRSTFAASPTSQPQITRLPVLKSFNVYEGPPRLGYVWRAEILVSLTRVIAVRSFSHRSLPHVRFRAI
jgi:hypothetical protein